MGKDNDMSFLVDCTRAAAELHDLLVCSQISFTAQKLIREETATVMISQKMSQTISIGYAKTLLVSVNFNQFLSRSEQFFSEVYFFENGIEAGNPRLLSGIQNTTIVEGTDEQPPKIEQQLQIPSFLAHRANPKSCILFLCKLALHTQDYYPVMYDNKDRWLGAMIGMQQTRATTIWTFDYTDKKQTRIAEKTALMNGCAWKKNQ